MKKLYVLLFVPVFIFCTGVLAFGGSASSTLVVSATMAPGCSIATSLLNFGEISPYSGADSYTHIFAQCTTGTNYSVSVDAGAWKTPGGSRAMALSTDTTQKLMYNLYYNNQGGPEIGDTGFGDTFPGVLMTYTGTGYEVGHPIYGVINIADLSTRPMGEYQDVLTVRVNF